MKKTKKIEVDRSEIVDYAYRKYDELKRVELEDSVRLGLVKPVNIEEVQIMGKNKEVDTQIVEENFKDALNKFRYVLSHLNAAVADIRGGDAGTEKRNSESEIEKATRHSIGKKMAPLSIASMVASILTLFYYKNEMSALDQVLAVFSLFLPTATAFIALAEISGNPYKKFKAEEKGISVSELNYINKKERLAAKEFNRNKVDHSGAENMLKRSDNYMIIKLKELYHEMVQTQKHFEETKEKMQNIKI